jgi:hypothetical protein
MSDPAIVPSSSIDRARQDTGPDQASEPKEVEYLTQRTSTDNLGRYTDFHKRRGFNKETSMAVINAKRPIACNSNMT